ncbi:MAG: secretin N-terminal domain-containing protein [Myxococcota bacterium]
MGNASRLARWTWALLALLSLPASADSVRVTGIEFELLEGAEALHVRSNGEAEIEVRELDDDTLSIGLRGAILEPGVAERIVPKDSKVVRVVTVTQAADERGPLLRVRIEHAPLHRPAIESAPSGFSAVFASLESQDPRMGFIPNFRSIPMAQFIRNVAAANGETLLVPSEITQRISVVGPRWVGPGELTALLDTALLMKNRVAVPMPGGGRKILGGVTAPFPWVPELPEDPDDSPLVTLLRLENVDSAVMIRVLQPMLGSSTLGIAHGATNSILLAGSGARVARLQRIARALDVVPEEEFLAIRLLNRSSDEIAGILEQILDKDMIVSTQSDSRTNTLLLRVLAEYVGTVRSLIERLDRKFELDGRLHVFRVQYADPERLAEQLIDLQFTDKPGRAAGQASLAGRAFKVALHEPTSSLVISADPDTARVIGDLLAEIDVPAPRVWVDVTLVEVITDGKLSVGFDSLVPFGNLESSGGIGGALASTPQSGSLSNLLAGGGGAGFVARMTRSPLVVPITDAAGAVVDVAIPREIFQLSVSESRSEARVLQNISLLVASGDEQTLVVGDNVPVPVAEGGSEGAVNSLGMLETRTTVERHDVGTTLRVSPSVGREGSVKLDLYVESSRTLDTAEAVEELLGPSFVERVVETTIQIPSGALAVIGFAVQPFFQEIETGVPYLRSIPVLGLLFRSRGVKERKATLLVAVRAEVQSSRSQALARALRRELSNPFPPEAAAKAAPAPPG